MRSARPGDSRPLELEEAHAPRVCFALSRARERAATRAPSQEANTTAGPTRHPRSLESRVRHSEHTGSSYYYPVSASLSNQCAPQQPTIRGRTPHARARVSIRITECGLGAAADSELERRGAARI